MEKFTFKSELIKEALWGRNYCDDDLLKSTNGYFNADTGRKGRAVAEYLVQHIFNIHRFPGFEPYYIKRFHYEFQKEYGLLNRKEIEYACEEYREYYEFLQDELKKSVYNKDDKIRLYRSLRPFEINVATHQIVSKCKEISIPANIINSYSYRGGYYYGTSMYIKRAVEIEKIVLWYDSLVEPGNDCDYQYVDGEYEVWVLEDDLFGETRIPVECFNYESLNDELLYRDLYLGSNYVNDQPLLSQNKDSPRPCELNWYTKLIIRHNKKLIKDKYPNSRFRNRP